jgi:hypothetical protein
MLSPSRTLSNATLLSLRALASLVCALSFSLDCINFETTEPLLTRFIAKEGQLSLEELDDFRYNGAPAAYSVKTGRIMENSDLQKLVEWKL